MMLYKQGLLLSLVFILLHSYRTTAQDSLLTEVEKFGNNPGHLRMFIHAGKNANANTKPLVVVLHGCGQTASEVAQLTGWNKLADPMILFSRTAWDNLHTISSIVFISAAIIHIVLLS